MPITILNRARAKSIMPRGLLLVIVFFAVIVASAYKPVSRRADPLTQIMHWTIDDTVRQALVYIPPTAKTKPTPIVFIFHGHGGNMQNMFKSRGFEKLWPEAIIICPQGLNTPGQLTDPEGVRAGWQKAPGDMKDRDLHFFDAMLKTLEHDYKVDTKRIYSTGHSNGGGFTYLLWATRGDVFAAVAPSAAAAGRTVKLLKPKPAMHIMGEKDGLVKAEWQRALCTQLLKINNCSTQGQKYDTWATLYPSTTGTPEVLYVHPGGHIYPTEANAVVVRFFKSIVKP